MRFASVSAGIVIGASGYHLLSNVLNKKKNANLTQSAVATPVQLASATPAAAEVTLAPIQTTTTIAAVTPVPAQTIQVNPVLAQSTEITPVPAQSTEFTSVPAQSTEITSVPVQISEVTSVPVEATPLSHNLSERQLEILKYGPEVHEIENPVFKIGYVASLNFKLRTPNWVLEHYTPENIKGNTEREGVDFFAEHSVRKIHRAENADYWHSGYSRGHMAAAGNHKQSLEALRDTFSLNCNIVPQDYRNNAFYWHRLELFARGLVAQEFKHVHVFTGPLWIPYNVEPVAQETGAVNETRGTTIDGIRTITPAVGGTMEQTGNKYVKYQVIGENNIAVPTHLFKVIFAEKDQQTRGLAAFVIPNKEIPENTALTDFQIPVETVEKVL